MGQNLMEKMFPAISLTIRYEDTEERTQAEGV